VAKFTEYLRLDEITKLKDREAKKIVMSKVDKLYSALEKLEWTPKQGVVGALMNLYYQDYDLSFTIAGSEEGDIGTKAGQDWFVDAVLMSDESIVMFIHPGMDKQISKIGMIEDPREREKAFKSGKFAKEFIQILSHELVHRDQWKKSKGKMLSKRYSADMPVRRYLSFPHEIEAQAHDAATKLHRGEEAPELEVYQIFGKKHPVFKKFMKKVFQFRKELEIRDET
jgi:hypothetical protein